MKLWPSTFVGVLSLFSFSCSSTASRDLWQRSVSQGKEIGPREPALLHTVAILDPDLDIGQFCSGVVIDKRLVLTAASCFVDKKRIPYAYMEKPYASGLQYTERGVLRRIEMVVVPANFDESRSAQQTALLNSRKNPKAAINPAVNKPLNNIALALLDEPVIDPYRPVKLFQGTFDFKKAQSFLAFYGCGGSHCDEDNLELEKASQQFVRYVPEAASVILSHSSSRSCQGARGGPIFYEDSQGTRLFAIRTSNEDLCKSGMTVDTVVPAYRSWIDEAKKVLAKPMIQPEGFRLIDFTSEPES